MLCCLRRPAHDGPCDTGPVAQQGNKDSNEQTMLPVRTKQTAPAIHCSVPQTSSCLDPGERGPACLAIAASAAWHGRPVLRDALPAKAVCLISILTSPGKYSRVLTV